MKYAVSGLSGFIGQHFKRMMSANEVVGISQVLLYSPNDLKKFFEKEKPDVILHLAAYGNHNTQDDINMTVFSNYIGTYNMLLASKDIKYQKFIMVGTSSEYGKKVWPMKENDICEPTTFYAASKHGAVQLARVFAQQKPIVIVRPFSVFGEGEAEFRLIPTIIKHLLDGKQMQLSTTQNHDWIYVEDFISGMMAAANLAKSGEIVNIGTGRETSNLEIAQTLERISGKKLNYKEIPPKPHDSSSWVADITKLSGYGWQKKYPLGLGLAKTFEFYKAEFAK